MEQKEIAHKERGIQVYIAERSLQEVFSNLEHLGQEGLNEVRKNRFGETALAADWQSEGIIINNFSIGGQRIRFISEEHGTIDLTPDPKVLGILDGLDGSNLYKRTHGKGRVGTMLAIYQGLNPKYKDYIFAGIMEFPAGRRYMTNINTAKPLEDNFRVSEGRRTIGVSDIKRLQDAKIYLDEGIGVNLDFYKKVKEKFRTDYSGSSAISYADLSAGRADVVLECTRKGNLEIAVAYPLVKQSGGVMVTADGRDIGDRYFLELGQNENVPIISAANSRLAREVLSLIS